MVAAREKPTGFSAIPADAATHPASSAVDRLSLKRKWRKEAESSTKPFRPLP